MSKSLGKAEMIIGLEDLKTLHILHPNFPKKNFWSSKDPMPGSMFSTTLPRDKISRGSVTRRGLEVSSFN